MSLPFNFCKRFASDSSIFAFAFFFSAACHAKEQKNVRRCSKKYVTVVFDKI